MSVINLFVIAQDHGEEYNLLSTEHHVIAFLSKHDAEDFSDTLDMDGEFTILAYEEAMGPCVVIEP